MMFYLTLIKLLIIISTSSIVSTPLSAQLSPALPSKLNVTGTYSGEFYCDGVGTERGSFTNSPAKSTYYIYDDEGIGVQIVWYNANFHGKERVESYRGVVLVDKKQQVSPRIGIDLCSKDQAITGWNVAGIFEVGEDESGKMTLAGTFIATGHDNIFSQGGSFAEICTEKLTRISKDVPEEYRNRPCK